jgi:hypothetical protein
MSDGKKQQKNRSDSIKQRRFHVLPPEITGGTVSPSPYNGQSEMIPGPTFAYESGDLAATCLVSGAGT